LFERLRLYFGAPTMVALEQLRQEVRDARPPVQQLAQPADDVSVGLPITPLHEPADTALAYLDAGTLHSLFTQLSHHHEILRQANLVVACPLTADAARALFQPSEMVVVARPQDWPEVLAGRRWDVIALVGLDLMQRALQSKQAPYHLIRACRRELLYLAQHREDVVHQRRSLHQIGFYEVASVLPDGRSDHITTGWSVQGDFLLRGSQPVLSWPGGKWCLHRASRVGQPEGPGTHRWKSVVGNGLQASALGWTGSANALSLSVCQGDGSSNYAKVYEQRVQAVMQWPLHSGEGHAALVGGYHGPGDAAMALAMIQVDRSGAVALSLWWHDDQWKCLISTQLSAEDCQLQDGYFRVRCWLHLTANHLRAGCGDHVQLEVPVIHGLFATAAGLRIHGQHIAVKDFEVRMGDGHV